MEYFQLAIKSSEVNDINKTTTGVGRGMGGSSTEGDKHLRKQKRALHDWLEDVVRKENNG